MNSINSIFGFYFKFVFPGEDRLGVRGGCRCFSNGVVNTGAQSEPKLGLGDAISTAPWLKPCSSST